MKIYLIGMPGSGKTTLGKQVAAHLLMEFVDLDQKIEEREGKSIPEIFAQHGEPYFRQVESDLLHEWAASAKSFVMATGGGAPYFHQGIDVINHTGISIFVDEPIEVLVRRTEKKSGRPLLQTSDEAALRNKLMTIRENRLPVYRKASIVLQQPDLAAILKALRL
jgi:shikimate kinase